MSSVRPNLIRGKKVFEDFVDLERTQPSASSDIMSLLLSSLERSLTDEDLEKSAENLVSASENFVERFGSVLTEDGPYLAAYANLQINKLLQIALRRGMINKEEHSDLKEVMDLPFIVLVVNRWKMPWPEFQALLNQAGASGKLEEPPRVEELSAQGRMLGSILLTYGLKVIIYVIIIIFLAATIWFRSTLQDRAMAVKGGLDANYARLTKIADDGNFAWRGSFSTTLKNHKDWEIEIRKVIGKSPELAKLPVLGDTAAEILIKTKFAHINELSWQVKNYFKEYLQLMFSWIKTVDEIEWPVWTFMGFPALQFSWIAFSTWAASFVFLDRFSGGAMVAIIVAVLATFRRVAKAYLVSRSGGAEIQRLGEELAKEKEERIKQSKEQVKTQRKEQKRALKSMQLAQYERFEEFMRKRGSVESAPKALEGTAQFLIEGTRFAVNE